MVRPASVVMLSLFHALVVLKIEVGKGKERTEELEENGGRGREKEREEEHACRRGKVQKQTRTLAWVPRDYCRRTPLVEVKLVAMQLFSRWLIALEMLLAVGDAHRSRWRRRGGEMKKERRTRSGMK